MVKYLIYGLAVIGGFVVAGIFQILLFWFIAKIVDKNRKSKEG